MFVIVKDKRRFLQNYEQKVHVQLLTKLPAETPVYVFSMYLNTYFPAVARYDLTWSSRFPIQWLLAGLLTDKDPEQAISKETVQYLSNAIVEDFAAYRPKIVIVDKDRNARAKGIGIDYIDWYTQNSPQFKKLWESYVYKTTLGDREIYVLQGMDIDEILKLIH